MNRLVYQQKALVGGCVADGVICSKPRRICGQPLHFHDPVKAHSRLLQIKNPPTDVYDAKAGTVLLDIIQSKNKTIRGELSWSPPVDVCLSRLCNRLRIQSDLTGKPGL